MTDQQKIEIITGCFVSSLLSNKLYNLDSYDELRKRLVALVDAEKMWEKNCQWREFLMTSWGPTRNN